MIVITPIATATLCVHLQYDSSNYVAVWRRGGNSSSVYQHHGLFYADAACCGQLPSYTSYLSDQDISQKMKSEVLNQNWPKSPEKDRGRRRADIRKISDPTLAGGRGLRSPELTFPK